ncbi:ArnT family glycosyltransferase [Plastorhodobacter daqingensis]|uniref:ArnT family glycosyltransferase n=1 Tax=Plastorhodobacter daqingensis TaxID=1387281 RepID=A0ABW2UGS0_9RHOB
MPKNVTHTDRRWLSLALLAILGLTLWRVALLPFSGIDLFVDESQYWLWGRELAFGHYSKPPMIGWVIRATTFLTGAEEGFDIRLALPILHGLTAVLILILAEELVDLPTAAVAAISYATLPAVSLGSILVSTDTPMLFFLAAALVCWVKLRAAPSLGGALLLGACLGLGMMSKYAMAYVFVGLGLVVALVPTWRIALRDGVVALLVAGLVVLPNVLWNLQHDMATLRHTADNAAWQGLQLNWGNALRFLAEQFAVAGPLVFAAILAQILFLRRTWEDEDTRALLLLALPALTVVLVQALISRAYANWAVGSYVAGVVLAAVWLSHRAPRLMIASLVINGLIALALPVAVTQAETLRRPDGVLLLKRHLGQEAISRRALDAARELGLDVIVAHDRGLLADLFYRTRDGGPSIYSLPLRNPVPHHYALLYPIPPGLDRPMLYLTFSGQARACDDPAVEQREVLGWTAGPGTAEGQRLSLLQVPPGCWN